MGNEKHGQLVSCCKARFVDGEKLHQPGCVLRQASEALRRGINPTQSYESYAEYCAVGLSLNQREDAEEIWRRAFLQLADHTVLAVRSIAAERAFEDAVKAVMGGGEDG